jgi:hypothetical protein
MILKIKAKIYQYTGIFLANKEEEAHIKRIEKSIRNTIWMRSFTNIMDRESLKNEYNIEISIAIGQWQADNGFKTDHNPYLAEKWIASMRKQKARYLYYTVVSFLYGAYSQLIMDIEGLVK